MPSFWGLFDALWLVSPVGLVSRSSAGRSSNDAAGGTTTSFSLQKSHPDKGLSKIHLNFLQKRHSVVFFDTKSDAIKVCGTYDRVGFHVILNVSDTVTCMVLYDTVSECGFSHIFYQQKGGGGWLI